MRCFAPIGSPAQRTAACAIALGGSLIATTAFAQQSGNGQIPGTTPYTTPQQAPPQPAPVFSAPLPSPAPTAPLPSPSPGAQPGYRPPSGPTPMVPGAPRDTPIKQEAGPSQVPDLNTAVPGGITADQVGKRAAETSYQARAAEETANSYQARADGAYANFVPRVGLKASYTRLSKFTPPSLGSIVATQAPANTINPTPTIAEGLSFPVLVNNGLLQATLSVPISDYFLKINENYTAALRQEEAARWDVATARAKSYSDGKLAYYTWLRARSSQVVAEQSLTVAKAHQKDAENQFAVGNASKADVLRAQTQVAAAELGVERGKNAVLIAERQIRIATHAKDDEKLEPGETLEGPVVPNRGDLKSLVEQAMTNRPELKSLDKNAEAARKIAKVSKAGAYPVLSGFGDLTDANPNQRRFPQTNLWFPTWSLGAQVTWSPSDYLAAGPGEADALARANSIEAQKQTTRDGIELDVMQSYTAVQEADFAIESTTKQLASAEEAYRVARELFNAGRGTSTTLIDAETALAQSRFEQLNAKVDAHTARIRLEHALGKDVGK